MNRFTAPAALAAIALACACSDLCGDELPDPRADVTIQTGVYGLVWVYDDESRCPHNWTPLQYPLELRDGDAVLARLTSDDGGFYQIPAPPGDYQLCQLQFPAVDACAAVTVGQTPDRWDFVLGGIRWEHVLDEP